MARSDAPGADDPYLTCDLPINAFTKPDFHKYLGFPSGEDFDRILDDRGADEKVMWGWIIEPFWNDFMLPHFLDATTQNSIARPLFDEVYNDSETHGSAEKDSTALEWWTWAVWNMEYHPADTDNGLIAPFDGLYNCTYLYDVTHRMFQTIKYEIKRRQWVYTKETKTYLEAVVVFRGVRELKR